jgi:hypothetical protein
MTLSHSVWPAKNNPHQCLFGCKEMPLSECSSHSIIKRHQPDIRLVPCANVNANMMKI